MLDNRFLFVAQHRFYGKLPTRPQQTTNPAYGQTPHNPNNNNNSNNNSEAVRRPSSNNMALADKRRAAAEARERAAAALARVRFISN